MWQHTCFTAAVGIQQADEIYWTQTLKHIRTIWHDHHLQALATLPPDVPVYVAAEPWNDTRWAPVKRGFPNVRWLTAVVAEVLPGLPPAFLWPHRAGAQFYNSAVIAYTWPCALRCHRLPPTFARPIEQACGNICTKP